MGAEFNGLPLYKAVFPEEADGILRVSLVDMPAVESDFMCFAKQSKVQTYSVANEEKRLVRGVILRADYPIYRIDPMFGEYYIMFNPKEIRELAERYLYDGRQNHVNLMHERNSDVAGVNLRQIFIKDTANGIDPKGFEEIEEGSLFGEYHVTNDEVWAEIKKGTYRGFSVEIMGAMADPFRKQTKSKNNMGFKEFVKKMVVKLAVVDTDKGVLAWNGENDLAVGDEVFIENNGEQETAPDGDYTTEQGDVIKVAGGKVAEIIEKEAETEAEPEEELAEEETPTEEEKPAEEANDTAAKIKELEDRIKALEDAMAKANEMADAFAKVQEQVEKFAKTSAATSAHERYEAQLKKAETGAARIASAKRD